MNDMNNKRAAIYARVSTNDQNCQRQVSDLTEYATRLGYDVVSVHQEKASGAKDDRKVRAEVLKLAKSKKIDVVLVTEMSRWGRSTVDLLNTLQELDAKKVSLVALNGPDFDLSTPTGKMMSTVLAAVAEFERDLIRERVKSGLANARANGKVLGRQEGDNYKQKKYEKKVLELRSQGKSYRAIADELKLNKDTVMKICQAAA